MGWDRALENACSSLKKKKPVGEVNVGGFAVEGVAGEAGEVCVCMREIWALSAVLLVSDGLFYVSASCPFQKRRLVLFAPAHAADTVQAHSASFLSQQILTRHLVYVRGQINSWGCRGDENTVQTPQQLTPGGGKTPVLMKCDKFSNAGVKRGW